MTVDLDRLEALARESYERRWSFTNVPPDEILRLIARLRAAEAAAKAWHEAWRETQSWRGSEAEET